MTHNVFALDQASFRARNDDGNETTATWIDTANSNWTQDVDTNFRVRFLMQESGAGTASGTIDGQLQYNLAGAGWNNVTTSSSVVKAVASTDSGGPYNGTATTTQLGSGTFVAGEISEDGLAAQVSLSGDDETELEYVLTIVSGDVTDAQTLQLRVTDGTTTPSWTNTPTITVNEAAAAQDINADYLASASSVYDPTVTVEQTIDADYLASASAVNEPTITTVATIDADYLASSSAVNEPTITTVATIQADYLASSSQIYQPDMGGALIIDADYLASNSQVYEPIITTLATIDADYLSSSSTVHEPTITTLATIDADYLASSSQVYEPTLIQDQFLSADYLASASQVYQPTVYIPGVALDINADYLASGAILYNPTVYSTFIDDLGLNKRSEVTENTDRSTATKLNKRTTNTTNGDRYDLTNLNDRY